MKNDITTVSNHEQDNVLTQHKQEARIDSRLFAQRIGMQHKNLSELIRKNVKPLRELGSLPSFETEAVKKLGGRGVKYQRYYLINENQFDYLCRLVRGRDAGAMKRFKLDDGLKALGAQRHHYINLARAENRAAGLGTGERPTAGEQQLGVLICMQKIEQAAFDEAIRQGKSPTDAVRDVAHRMEMFASLMSPRGMLQ